MGATIPARIQPGSIDHVYFLLNSCTLSCLGRLWLYEIKPAGETKIFSLIPSRVIAYSVHRRGNRNASCSAGVVWSGSVAGDQSPGQTNPPPRRIVLCPNVTLTSKAQKALATFNGVSRHEQSM
ncbi:hypothetical protein EJ110_NYTH50594 [Nymphaea thermarum]|nr:hypothetical protein EJ110_NYTH50594 [Nymphaea thermarum]